jgi:hypothetical protein
MKKRREQTYVSDEVEQTIIIQAGKLFAPFTPLNWGQLFSAGCFVLLLVLVLWLFVASRRGRATPPRSESSPLSGERRAFLIKLDQDFERLKAGHVYDRTPETATSQTSLGNSVHHATFNGEPDFRAALDRAEADLLAMKALLAEASVNLDDIRQQRDDALRDRDDWRSRAEEWKAQAERPTLKLPSLRLVAPGTMLPPSRRSLWPGAGEQDDAQ